MYKKISLTVSQLPVLRDFNCVFGSCNLFFGGAFVR
jgi:hypothetical protein